MSGYECCEATADFWRVSRVLAALRSRLADLPGDYVLDGLLPMADVVGESLVTARLAAAVGTFAALTLTLALVGLYDVVNFVVSQRMHEFGVRLELGARPRDLLTLVLWQGMVLPGGAAVCTSASPHVPRLASLQRAVRPAAVIGASWLGKS